jgi:NAD kinase
MFDKLVVVTRRTRLEDLIARFNTRGQARFYLEHAGVDFTDYEREHDTYQAALDRLRRDLELGLPRQFLDRDLVPTYLFGRSDLVITLGPDGLVANTAKYARGQAIIGVNPDPDRFDGVLLPFTAPDARRAVLQCLETRPRVRAVTLAEARLNDGQRLLAFNDLFVGAKSHVSARYRLRLGDREERQSSSGVLVSTGAGSTGWMSSVFNMAAGVTTFAGGHAAASQRLSWSDRRLLFAVREPFISRHSSAQIVAGLLEQGEELIIESQMPSGGVIFSDGIEADFLAFNSGAVARIKPAGERAMLVIPPPVAAARSSTRKEEPAIA